MTLKESLCNTLNALLDELDLERIEVDDPNDLSYMDYWNGFKALTDLAYAAALYDGDYEAASSFLNAAKELERVKKTYELADEFGYDHIELDDKNLSKLILN